MYICMQLGVLAQLAGSLSCIPIMGKKGGFGGLGEGVFGGLEILLYGLKLVQKWGPYDMIFFNLFYGLKVKSFFSP